MDQRSDRIVVGLDDSDGGRAALRFALRDAARRDASVEVVAAFEPPEHWAATFGGLAARPVAGIDDVRIAVREHAVRVVDEVCRQVGSNGPAVAVSAVAGAAGEVLVNAAREADLLVVGTRGHRGLASAVLGSVSLHCVLHAPCPVTVVRPDRAADDHDHSSGQPGNAAVEHTAVWG
ncbi:MULTISPECIES: universal stress protein [unclassified Pseudonocardia]|jgi:nucleotide-binding universal stress UspA family protein|uniref:universal stress protein n=1 Tax=unclassified Pseudonocardia TaxID=2619320 RepID=UPI00095C3997|nr:MULTISPECIES: universal stress protein [unclassified Pseudonocardia]MBN9101010.1 universal stress protein [Pseudonocardia sp.]OJY39345.1 MAG: hypothetical protein BGP03_05945 [Pseudonocardia sp. 73-21]